MTNPFKEQYDQLSSSKKVTEWLDRNRSPYSTGFIKQWLKDNKYKLLKHYSKLEDGETSTYIKRGRRYRFRQNSMDLWYRGKADVIMELGRKRPSDDCDQYHVERYESYLDLMDYYDGECPYMYNEWVVDISCAEEDFDRWANSCDITLTANAFIDGVNSKELLYDIPVDKIKKASITEEAINRSKSELLSLQSAYQKANKIVQNQNEG